MTALVNLETEAGVAVVTLNRPEALNALSRALRRELADALAQASADKAVRAIIITGAGERAFCAGVDLKELAALQPAPTDGAADPVAVIAACRKPVLAAINGAAITGGLELALACDILLASTKARFADTHVRVGVIPGWGLSQRLSRLIGVSRAKEMSLSGRMIDAQTALAWGLVNRVVAPEDLLPAARALAAEIAGCDPQMVAAYKALIDDGFALPFGPALQLEQERSQAHLQDFARDRLADAREALLAHNRGQLGADARIPEA